MDSKGIAALSVYLFACFIALLLSGSMSRYASLPRHSPSPSLVAHIAFR